MAMTLDDFIPRVVPYDHVPGLQPGLADAGGIVVDFVPALKRFVWISAAITMASLLVMVLLPSDEAVRSSGFFLLLRGTVAGTVALFRDLAPFLVTLDLIQLAGLTVVG